MKDPLFPDAPLLHLAVCLMAGILLADRMGAASTTVPWLLACLVASLTVPLLLGRWPRAQSVAIAVCVVLLGSTVMALQRQSATTVWPKAAVEIEAVALTEPVEKARTMAVDILLTTGGRKLKCYLAKDGRSARLRVGDGLRLRSVVRPNPEWRRGHFDYRRYLEVHGFAGTVYAAAWQWRKVQVSLGGLPKTARTRLFFLRQRSKLLHRLRSQADGSADAYAVVAAMTLGDKSALSADLKAVYAQTGASHVLALSGLHLGIVYAVLSLIVVGRRWRAVSQGATVLAIWAYVFLVGLPASVVRSAVMLSVYALLSLGWRDRMSVNALAFTAIVMLTVWPYALFDVGFQMSFMAVFAILTLMPMFSRMVSQRFLMDHRLLKWAWGLVSVSCAAQVGVAPLVAYYFGRVSTCFLLTNFIVVPAATLILYLSLIVVVLPQLAPAVFCVARVLNGLLARMAALPGSSLEGLHPTVLQVVMVYVVIGAVCLLVRRFSTSGLPSGHGSPQR